ncbi:MAG: hypothetical protein PWQ41_1868 [Bacillota bacterium]|jgi:hypothetical protein|nr:hypothetical protein [Bacillota bacterium]MDK2856802.1 hypothetical protein [Bacillota bacterium]MDK2926094.1 hypothetical protein [Bacillota bacterium]
MANWRDTLRILIIVAGITLVGNLIGFKVNPIEAIPGMLVLLGIVIAGLILAKLIPLKLPSIVYISLIGIILTIPGFPGAAWFAAQANKVQFLALCTPVLAYAGIASGKDLDEFKKLGWRIVVVSIFVFIGTFVGSAAIAQVVLKLTGQI